MNIKDKLNNRKKEIIAILILILIALTLLICVRLFAEGEGKYVKVYVDNKLKKTFNLNNNSRYLIDTKKGYNLLIIKDGKARIVDADCPNKICVDKGFISKNDESIICLPHNVVVTVESNEKKQVDAVAN